MASLSIVILRDENSSVETLLLMDRVTPQHTLGHADALVRVISQCMPYMTSAQEEALWYIYAMYHSSYCTSLSAQDDSLNV